MPIKHMAKAALVTLLAGGAFSASLASPASARPSSALYYTFYSDASMTRVVGHYNGCVGGPWRAITPYYRVVDIDCY